MCLPIFGTRISGWLGDEDDIHAVLSGLAGRDALRGMLEIGFPLSSLAPVKSGDPRVHFKIATEF